MHRWRSTATFLSLVAGVAGCSGGGQPASSPVPPSAASLEIAVSKSTNTDAYTIVVGSDAVASVTQDGSTQQVPVTPADVARLLRDAAANAPVGRVATTVCPKSASFGTTTMLTYDGSTSGDISCPPSPTSAAATLYADEQRIASDIGAVVPLGRPPAGR